MVVGHGGTTGCLGQNVFDSLQGESHRAHPHGRTVTPAIVRPGVVAEIATAIANYKIGISGTHSPINSSNPDAEFVDMVFLLHSCPFGKLTKALAEIEALDCVNSQPVVFRIENLG